MTLAFEGATIQSGFSTRSIPSRPHLMSLERAKNQWYSYFIWGLHESQGQIQEAHNLVLLCPKGPSWHKFCLFHFLSRGEKTAGVNLKSSSRMPLDMLYKPYQNSVIIQWSSDPFLRQQYVKQEESSFWAHICPKRWKPWEVLGTGISAPEEVELSLPLIDTCWEPGALSGRGLRGPAYPQSQGNTQGGGCVRAWEKDHLVLTDNLGHVPYPLCASVSSSAKWGQRRTPRRAAHHTTLGRHKAHVTTAHRRTTESSTDMARRQLSTGCSPD